jgi:ABC-type hemin transport system ATPase subunit
MTGLSGRPPALHDVDLRIAAGETIAIVGSNGAGKSTLAHLLLRLHEPDADRITIDGIDIASVSLESLRKQIGVVPQHVLLFNASVRATAGEFGGGGQDGANGGGKGRPRVNVSSWTCADQSGRRAYAARTSVNNSGWRSSTLSNLTSTKGGLVLPSS